jgi:hypothetical protein
VTDSINADVNMSGEVNVETHVISLDALVDRLDAAAKSKEDIDEGILQVEAFLQELLSSDGRVRLLD